jgi:murein DD-endopeptidase MepM/ murein hydrolase activator NlpD
MRDYLRRLLIAGIMAICVGLLFLGFINVKAETLNVNEQDWMWPSEGTITDSFGTRNGHHKGIDIAAPLGSSVYAVDSGVVSKSYYSDTYGNVVFIKHDNGIETVYAHLQTRKVQEGKRVEQGHIIGKMGNTGDSSGVHLHFEVHQSEWTLDKKNAINPMLVLGEAEIGESVAAVQNRYSKRAIATAGRLDTEELHMDHKGQTVDSKTLRQNRANQSKVLKTEYIVQQGETLWSIAKKHHSSVGLIQKSNGLTNETIKIGQKLIIPVGIN